MMNRLVRSSPLLAALAAAVLALAACTGEASQVSAPQGGGFELVTPGGKTTFDYPVADRKSLGEISGPALTGDGRISVADYPNTVVVLNFWGSWCGPCRAEAPLLASAATTLKSDGVQFLGINSRETDRENGADFDAVRATPYPSIYDQQLRVLASIRGYPINAIPSTIVLDRQHRVAWITISPIANPADLTDAVRKIAAET
ncbi:MAG: TlpA disulfide reductase family protein [Nakamurella sp.]